MSYYINAYEPSFPRPSSESYPGSGHVDYAQMGMNNIQYFTAAAMQGFAANPAMNNLTIKELAEMSVELAHETIEAMKLFVPRTP